MSRVMASSAVNDEEYYTISSQGPQALPLRWMVSDCYWWLSGSVMPTVWVIGTGNVEESQVLEGD